MNIRILIISLIALGMQSITFGQDKAKLEKECLDLFKTVSLPFELKANEDGIQSPEQGSLTAEMQEKIFNMGGFDEEGFGMHMGAVGKVELSKGMYLLMYSTLVVPVPSHMDEYSFAIYTEGSYKLENVTDLAYTRGGIGMDEGTLTVKVSQSGKNVELKFHLISKKAIETDDGPDWGPAENYEWTHTVDSKGKLQEGKKTKVK